MSISFVSVRSWQGGCGAGSEADNYNSVAERRLNEISGRMIGAETLEAGVWVLAGSARTSYGHRQQQLRRCRNDPHRTALSGIRMLNQSIGAPNRTHGA
jgi:hypothetical protein